MEGERVLVVNKEGERILVVNTEGDMVLVVNKEGERILVVNKEGGGRRTGSKRNWSSYRVRSGWLRAQVVRQSK